MYKFLFLTQQKRWSCATPCEGTLQRSSIRVVGVSHNRHPSHCSLLAFITHARELVRRGERSCVLQSFPQTVVGQNCRWVGPSDAYRAREQQGELLASEAALVKSDPSLDARHDGPSHPLL